jgi:hypothetical protein
MSKELLVQILSHSASAGARTLALTFVLRGQSHSTRSRSGTISIVPQRIPSITLSKIDVEDLACLWTSGWPSVNEPISRLIICLPVEGIPN